MSLNILTPDQKQFFDENGYLVLPGFYRDALPEMREKFHDLITNVEGRPKNMSYAFMEPAEGFEPDTYNPRNVQGVMDQPMADDYWYNHLVDPRMLNVFMDLMGPDIDFHNGKVRNNPPGFFNSQSWHQDWPYERHTKPELAAAITYLEDNGRDAGATSVIPGSHLQGEYPTGDRGHTIPDDAIDASKSVTFEAEGGDVLIIHVLVVHTAGHNKTPVSRHKIINEYKTKAAVDLWNNRCALAGLPLTRDGRIVTHPIG